MEYYSDVKKNNIMKSAGKWIELEKKILSDITQTQKDGFAYVWILVVKSMIAKLQYMEPQKLHIN